MHEKRLRGLLDFLEAAVTVADMDLPELHLHALKGDRKDYWAVKINGNYWLIFRFVNGNVYDVDVVDYHGLREYHHADVQSTPSWRTDS